MTLQTLGKFKKTDTGFVGRIKTLHIDREIFISKANQKDHISADYCINSDCSTLGYGWNDAFDEEEAGIPEECIRLEFTEPLLDKPFEAKLVQDEGVFNLLWRIPTFELGSIRLAKLDQKTIDKWNALKRRNREVAYGA